MKKAVYTLLLLIFITLQSKAQTEPDSIAKEEYCMLVFVNLTGPGAQAVVNGMRTTSYITLIKPDGAMEDIVYEKKLNQNMAKEFMVLLNRLGRENWTVVNFSKSIETGKEDIAVMLKRKL